MTQTTPFLSPALSRSGSRSASILATPIATLALGLTLGATLLFTIGCKSNPPAPDNTGSQPQTSNAPAPGAPPAAGGSSTSGSAASSSSAIGSTAPGSPASGSAAPAAPAMAAAPMPPPPPPPPAFIDVTIPPGKSLPFRINQALDSGTTQAGESISGVINSNVVVNGQVVIPAGTPVSGRVTEVHEAAHYKGSSLLSIELTSMRLRGQNVAITVTPYSQQGKGRGKNTAIKTGGGAAGGALLGGLIGGGKGAGIGAIAGAGAGLVANGVTRGEQVKIPSETLIQFKLSNSILVSVPNNPAEAPSDSQGRQPLPPPSAQ